MSRAGCYLVCSHASFVTSVYQIGDTFFVYFPLFTQVFACDEVGAVTTKDRGSGIRSRSPKIYLRRAPPRISYIIHPHLPNQIWRAHRSPILPNLHRSPVHDKMRYYTTMPYGAILKMHVPEESNINTTSFSRPRPCVLPGLFLVCTLCTTSRWHSTPN